MIEHEKLEVQDSEQEARDLSFNEYPSGTLKLQYNFETIEQQFCDLPDNKDSAECDIAEVDGELFVAQSNFTLILEGEEGEVETGDSAASNVLGKAANTATEEEHVYTEENDNVAKLPSVLTSDQESQKVETLPYVPEPIKVAIAENLLDVIKDTRSKEITSNTMEQSIHENVPLISQKLVKSTFKTLQETSTMTLNVSQVDDMISSRTRRRGRVQNLDGRSVHQEESVDVATPEMLGLPVKKKTRKTKEISETSISTVSDFKGISQNQQIPQNSTTPRRGKRKQEINQDTLQSINSMEQEVPVTPGRELRRLRASQLLEPSAKETSFRKEIKLSSVTKRTPQRIKKSVENQESVEIVNDLKVNKVTNPSRSTRKLRRAGLEASEDTGRDHDGKPSEQQLPVQGSKRVTRGAGSASGVSEDAKLDSSRLAPQVECGDLPATPRKRGRPRKIHPSQDGGSEAVKEDRNPKKSEALGIQRRPTRNTPAKSASPGVGKPALENSVFVPNEELVTVMSSKKKTTKRTENQSQKPPLWSISEKSIDEEMMNKEPSDRKEKLAKPALTQSSHSTRTRSSKSVLPDLSEPKNETLFSPPVSKAPRKRKGNFISIQLLQFKNCCKHDLIWFGLV